MALRLRPVRRADLDTLERWWNDPEAQDHHLVPEHRGHVQLRHGGFHDMVLYSRLRDD